MEYLVTLTNDQKIRAMRELLKSRGVTVSVAVSKRLNVEGMEELVAVTGRHLRIER